MICTFRPAFVVVDQDVIANGQPDLLDCLIAEQLAMYKDSSQQKIEWEDKDVGWGVVLRLPRVYAKELEHRLILTVEGDDALRSKVHDCLAQAAIGSMLAAIAAAFTGVGIGAISEVAKDAFVGALLACVGAAIGPNLNDQQVWSDWHPV